MDTKNIATTEELQYIALALGYVPEAKPATDKLGIIFKAINQLERNDNGDLVPALKVANPTLRQSYIELTGDFQIEFRKDMELSDLLYVADYLNSYPFVLNVTLNLVVFYEEDADLD